MPAADHIRSILQQLPIIVVVFTLEDQRILEMSTTFEERTGLRRAEIIGRKFGELEIWEDQRIVVRITDLLQSRTNVRSEELWFRSTTGERRLGLFSVITTEIDGEQCGIAFAEDITDLHATHASLERSESRFRSLSEHSSTGVLIVQDNKLRYVNPTLCKMLGYEEAEMLDGDPLAFVHPDDRGMVGETIRLRLAGKEAPPEYRFRCVRKDRSVIWAEVHVSLIEYEGKPASLGNLLDVSERMRIEESLRMTQFSIDTTVDGIFWIRSDSTFSYVNDAACSMFGYSRQEILAMHMTDFDPDYSPHTSGMDRNSHAGSQSKIFEARLKRKDGRLLPVEISSSLLRSGAEVYDCSFVRDITDRKRREEEIQRLNAELEERVQRRTAELEQANFFLKNRTEELDAFNRAMLGRESRVIELKEEVNRLCAELNRPPAYPPVWEKDE